MRRTCLFVISLAVWFTGCQCCSPCGPCGGGCGSWFNPPRFGWSLCPGGGCNACAVGKPCGGCFGKLGCRTSWFQRNRCNDCGPCATGCDSCESGCDRGWSGFCHHVGSKLGWCPPNHYSRCQDRCVTKHYAKSLAKKRLDDLGDESGESFSCHFEEGFEQAYVDIAEGGSGVTPAIPPERYWGFRYRTPQGHTRAQEWFSGYELGANLAEHDGLKYNTIPTSARGWGHESGEHLPADGHLPTPDGYQQTSGYQPVSGGPMP